MRRKEKEISEKSEIDAVIHKSIVCRVGLSDDNFPYIVPLCFGYKDNTIYVHGSPEGKKIDIIKRNTNVCFEFDIDVGIVKHENACNWGMRYRSIIGFGRASLIDNPEQKRNALNIIMNQYSEGVFKFPDSMIGNTSVIKIEITSMTGKQSGM